MLSIRHILLAAMLLMAAQPTGHAAEGDTEKPVDLFVPVSGTALPLLDSQNRMAGLLVLDFRIEAKDVKAVNRINALMPRIRDTLNTRLKPQTSEILGISADDLIATKRDILALIRHAVGREAVQAIYFTSVYTQPT